MLMCMLGPGHRAVCGCVCTLWPGRRAVCLCVCWDQVIGQCVDVYVGTRS